MCSREDGAPRRGLRDRSAAQGPARRRLAPAARALSIAALLWSLWPEGEARADPLADLETAYDSYASHKYDDAEARLRALLDAKTGELKDADNVADARMYLGAVLVAEGRKDEASNVFEWLLEDKPAYDPDRLRVSLDAIYAFLDVKTRLRDKQQAAELAKAAAEKELAEAALQRATLRVRELRALAAEERVVEKSSRWVALVPFGVGQFQNGQNDLGWVFLAGEALLAVGSAVLTVTSVYEVAQESDALSVKNQSTALFYRNNAYATAVAGDALAGAFALAAVAGAVHAELTFVPEHVHTRPRALPPLSLAPLVGPGSVGFVLRF